MGCFDTKGKDDDKPIDLSKAVTDAEKAHAADRTNISLSSMLFSIFRSRAFMQSSIQAKPEPPDPLFQSRSPRLRVRRLGVRRVV